MKQGIGPHNLGVSKRVEKMAAVPKMYKAAPTKLDTDPPKKKAGIVTRLDAEIASRASKSTRKPAAEQGSMQEFLNQGPGPFIRRGAQSVKKAVKKLSGSTYGTSIK